jgi:hypothetical protein
MQEINNSQNYGQNRPMAQPPINAFQGTNINDIESIDEENSVSKSNPGLQEILKNVANNVAKKRAEDENSNISDFTKSYKSKNSKGSVSVGRRRRKKKTLAVDTSS